MGRLFSILQDYMDAQRFPVSERQIARALGVSPTSLTNWKSLRKLPEESNLRAIAQLTGTSYSTVLEAALIDAGYIKEVVGHVPAPITQARESSGRPGMTAARWDRAAAALRSDPLFKGSEEDLVEVLGRRPGEVNPSVTGDAAGGGRSTGGRRRQA